MLKLITFNAASGRILMLEIRRYQDADNLAVWELHHRALKATGAYFPGKWNDDLDDIQNHSKLKLPPDIPAKASPYTPLH